ncbi:MAG: hypothetical protein AAGA18_08900 [Verrucomicrobiota bacterium]
MCYNPRYKFSQLATKDHALCLTVLALILGYALSFAETAIKLDATLYHGQDDLTVDHLEEKTKLKKKLTRLFGYEKYQKLGYSQADLKSAMPQKLKPSKKFYLNLMHSDKRKNAYKFEVVHEERRLFQGEFVPKTNLPLIIRGPQFGQGVLILVLQGIEP